MGHTSIHQTPGAGMIKTYPKVKHVKPLTDKRLEVLFEGDIKKIYDCRHLLENPAFQVLLNEALFKSVTVDLGGHGISWSDEIDLSEAELWINGQEPIK